MRTADAQADLSLRLAHNYFVGFVMSPLILHLHHLQDNNPFSEEFQEREQMEKMRESQGKQIPPTGPLEKPAGKFCSGS